VSEPAHEVTVRVFVRHKATCDHHGEEGYANCRCLKWLRWSRHGKQFRQTASTRSWGSALEKARELERRLTLGEMPVVPKPDQPKKATIADKIATHILAKQSEGFSNSTRRKLKYQLGLFERWMADRSKFFPHEITTDDCVTFRASWKWKSGVTRQKAQQNLRGFLRSACEGKQLEDILRVLKPIKLTKEDTVRLKPQPFSDKELTTLIAQVPKTFPDDATKQARVIALIHCQVETGLAIRDTVQLERGDIKDGWLRIERQKTGRPVRQPLRPGLYDELVTVTNGNPKYVFWNGTSLPESATGLWQTDLRQLMQDAGVWIKGNLSHRFRDTAVDFWLSEGRTVVQIAAYLGDTTRIVERHYADLISERMEKQLASVPFRSWGSQSDRDEKAPTKTGRSLRATSTGGQQ
jgi:integrase